jgi:mycothiol system anti-sigma-R factor
MPNHLAPKPAEPSPCADVIQRMYEFLDGELSPEVDEQIRHHLQCCQRCFPEFEHERVFLRFLERRAQIEKAPPSLRRRIFEALLNEEAARSRR